MPIIIPGNRLASTGYAIDQSIRFNDGDSAYMHRTPSGAGDRRTFTYSVWFKLGDMATTQRMLLSVRNSDTTRDNIMINQGGAGDYRIYFDARVGGSAHTELEPTRALRDPSAWYHLVVSVDTTNAVSTERVRLYFNGARETAFTTQTLPSLNQQFQINNTDKHAIGRFEFSSPQSYWDGYMAEMVMIDGQALDPSSFGEYNSSNIWIPKDVSGLTFGTNGFHIDGRDSADLGDDESGNGNDFTTSGLAAHDQVFDTPTNNFCILNPVDKPAYGSYAVRNVTGTNLQVTENGDGVVQSYGMGTMAVSSGKWYYEIYTNTYPGGNALAFGWIDLENAETATDSGNSWKTPGMNQRHTTSAYSFWTWGLNNLTSTGLTPFGQGVTIGVTTDFDNNTFTLTKDGSAYGSVDFDTTSPTYTFSGVEHKPILFFGADGASLATLNFGQDSTFNGAVTAGGNADENGHGNFKYAVPSGALALCTRNLGAD